MDAKLDKRFWAEAVNTAVYLRNRSTVSGLQSKTPFEVWYGKKPDVISLRIFGSKVMTHVPKATRLKFDSKSKQMILVGYSETTKCYRLYDPETKNVTVSRDVVIMEEIEDQATVVISEKEIANPTVVVERMEITDSVGETEEENSLEILSDVSVEKTEKGAEETEISSGQEECDDTSDEDYVSRVTVVPVQTNRPKRTVKPKDFSNFATYMCTESLNIDDPISVGEAMSRPDAEMWKKAMSEELQSFEQNNAWDIVDWPEGSSAAVVKSKWVFKRKCSREGVVKYRARLVAKGFLQKYGIDYEETFSPVVKHSSLRLLFALSVKLGLDINHLDVKTAFLNGHLKENVYMQMPEGFVCNDKSKCLKLNRAIYGLKQSSYAWNERVNSVLLALDYQKSVYEPCLYIKKQNGCITIIAVYVDDFFIFSNNENETNRLKSELSSKFKITDLGRIKECIGMQVDYDFDNHVIKLSEKLYHSVVEEI